MSSPFTGGFLLYFYWTCARSKPLPRRNHWRSRLTCDRVSRAGPSRDCAGCANCAWRSSIANAASNRTNDTWIGNGCQLRWCCLRDLRLFRRMTALAVCFRKRLRHGGPHRSSRNGRQRTPPGPEGSNGSCRFVCRDVADGAPPAIIDAVPATRCALCSAVPTHRRASFIHAFRAWFRSTSSVSSYPTRQAGSFRRIVPNRPCNPVDF